jgi:prepilin-type N-terminal cleavage/methylation domain-containing protein
MRVLRPKIAKIYRRSEFDRNNHALHRPEAGFSLIELLISMVVTLVILGVAILTYSGGMKSREEENGRTDALTSAQAALNVMSREIANSGFGLTSNGIVIADSDADRIRVRANLSADDLTTDDESEDVTYFYDAESQSILRFDPISGTSAVINRVSRVSFEYFNWGDVATVYTVPTSQTSQVRIRLWVELADAAGQPINDRVEFASRVTLRNSPLILNQY